MPDTAAEVRSVEPDQEAMPAMSFLEHLDELRKRIFHSLVAVAAGAVVSWFYRETLVGYMQRPIVQVLRSYHLPEQLVYLNPTEPFNLYLKVSILAGLDLSLRALPSVAIHFSRALPP